MGSDDVTGEANAEDYAAELKEIASRYEEALEAEQCCVHIRAKRSSNRDLKMLSRMTGSQGLKMVNRQGPDLESVITNSAYVAALLGGARCETREGVEKLLEEEEVKFDSWDD